MAHTLSRDLQRAARAAGGPEALWGAPRPQMGHYLRAGPDVVTRALEARAVFRAHSAREELGRRGIVHIPVDGDPYPAALRAIVDPPFGLFGVGAVMSALAKVATSPVVAVVGSRHPTAAGRRFTAELTGSLVSRGAVVISGLAHGVDTAAHEGALEAGGVTIGVLGSGVDHIHPRRNVALAGSISRQGAIVSEYWPDTPPAPWRFPARNRIVAGMADAVVVVEAAERSGALITADFALEQGTPVLAVPGWPGAELSVGCNALIRAGAAMCEGADDVVHEIPFAAWRDVSLFPRPTGTTGAVLSVLNRESCGVDRVTAESGLRHGEVAMALVSLEMEGIIVREPGGVFRVVGLRSERAGAG